MARLYSNENFPYPTVEALRAFGHDVVTTQDVGQSGQQIPDEQVLTFASTEQRAVITLNRDDFRKLHQLSADHFGIIICTVDPNFAALAQRIHDAISPLESLAGLLVRINRSPK